MLLARDVIGEFFDSSVEEFYRQHHKQCAYHGGIPGGARGNNEAEQHTQDDEQGFVAQRGLSLEAVDKTADRILRSAVETFQD